MYHSLGEIPKKRHTVFRQKSGELYAEELFGTAGFIGMSSLVYHLRPPTLVASSEEPYSVEPKTAIAKNLKALSFNGFNIDREEDYIKSRKTLLVNSDLQVGVAAPKHFSKDYFYKNADSDELLFIHHGSGTLKSTYGQIKFGYGDYLVIPRGTIYQIDFDSFLSAKYY